nr:class B sortase [uncultured Ruminococcus sp.]
MNRSKKPKWIILLCVSIAVIIGALIFLFLYLNQKDYNGDQLPTSAPVAETTTPQPTASATEKKPVDAWGHQTSELGDHAPDFDELMEINPDIYAWIYIPNTNVDYPVARSTGDGDDSFYLEHNVYRQYQFSGTIYSEIKNQPDMHDRVTVFYGHNMLNGSMFASLHNFEDKSFFDQNNTAFVLTKDKVFTYLIYSAYTFDDRHILNTYFLGDNESFQEYLDSTLAPHSYDANVREGVELSANSKILTLSTCTAGASNTRYLVQGVLVDESDRR